jgi:hypothetical protein
MVQSRPAVAKRQYSRCVRRLAAQSRAGNSAGSRRSAAAGVSGAREHCAAAGEDAGCGPWPLDEAVAPRATEVGVWQSVVLDPQPLHTSDRDVAPGRLPLRGIQALLARGGESYLAG